jgi:hypothetical protein
LIFPSRHAGSRGNRIGQKRLYVSHAGAFRRDLQEAFNEEHVRAVHEQRESSAPPLFSARWRELFVETEYTKPVDFHSWRRAFSQALADAGVNVQQAIALTGHSDAQVHARYLRNSGTARQMPAAALPAIVFLPSSTAGSLGSAGAQSIRNETDNINDSGAGNRIRTDDLQLGKLPLYR